jgi:IS5 family transposase
MVRSRTGSDGRINGVKRDFGLARTRSTGSPAHEQWCDHGMFAHDLVKISDLIG